MLFRKDLKLKVSVPLMVSEEASVLNGKVRLYPRKSMQIDQIVVELLRQNALILSGFWFKDQRPDVNPGLHLTAEVPETIEIQLAAEQGNFLRQSNKQGGSMAQAGLGPLYFVRVTALSNGKRMARNACIVTFAPQSAIDRNTEDGINLNQDENL